MKARARAAAPLPLWALIGLAGLASTLSFTAVAGSQAGCIDTGVADLISILAIAGLGLAVAALLMVSSVPRYRAPAPLFSAATALVLSVYAVVIFLTQDGAVCAI